MSFSPRMRYFLSLSLNSVPGILGEQHTIALTDVHRHTGTNHHSTGRPSSDHLALLRLFLGRLGQHQAVWPWSPPSPSGSTTRRSPNGLDFQRHLYRPLLSSLVNWDCRLSTLHLRVLIATQI